MSFPVSVLLMFLMNIEVLLLCLRATMGISFGVATEDSILMTQVYITPFFFPTLLPHPDLFLLLLLAS